MNMLSLFRSTPAARSDSRVPHSLISPDELGGYFTKIHEMEEANTKRGAISAVTRRFRQELCFYLLDNPSNGPIIEVGIQSGGTTCILAYIGAVTSREVFGIDIAKVNIEYTKAACARYGLRPNFFHGDLAQFIAAGHLKNRPDLLFLDSDHCYNVTLEELRTIHSQPHIPRCIALHDFNYRIEGHMPGQKDNPIAVDHALHRFLSDHEGPMPTVKRIGALAGDGTASSRTARGGHNDFIDDFGSEGVMLFRG